MNHVDDQNNPRTGNSAARKRPNCWLVWPGDLQDTAYRRDLPALWDRRRGGVAISPKNHPQAIPAPSASAGIPPGTSCSFLGGAIEHRLPHFLNCEEKCVLLLSWSGSARTCVRPALKAAPGLPSGEIDAPKCPRYLLLRPMLPRRPARKGMAGSIPFIAGRCTRQIPSDSLSRDPAHLRG